jgi:hypothetical protein
MLTYKLDRGSGLKYTIRPKHRARQSYSEDLAASTCADHYMQDGMRLELGKKRRHEREQSKYMAWFLHIIR